MGFVGLVLGMAYKKKLEVYQMKAWVVRKYGFPENMSIIEVPKPEIAFNEILVKIKAVSINDWDLSNIEGKPWINRLLAGPFRPKIQIMGCDIAGVVEAVGQSVSKFKVGDKVYGDLSSHKFGGFAEYVATRENQICHMAEGMSFEVAAAIPQAGMLAYQALHDFSEIKEGMNILVNGAGGGVGTYVVQMLKNHKVHLTGVDSEAKREFLLQLGYDAFVNYQKEDFTESDIKYDIIIDCKTNRPFHRYSKKLKENGEYISIGGDLLKVIRIMLMSKQLEKKYGKKFSCVQLNANRNLPQINKIFENGLLNPIIDSKRFTLKEGRKALEYYASGLFLGKVLIKTED